MTEYLIDTNVISEVTKRRPAPGVVAWLRSSPTAYLSVLTLGELWRGVTRQRERDAEHATRLTTWLRQLEQEYAGNVLDVDASVVAAWAALPTSRTLPVVDSLIAATALAHDLTVVTRNTADFAGTSVPTFDPFATLDD